MAEERTGERWIFPPERTQGAGRASSARRGGRAVPGGVGPRHRLLTGADSPVRRRLHAGAAAIAWQIASRTGKSLGYFYAEGEDAEEQVERAQAQLREEQQQVRQELERLQTSVPN